MRNKLGLVILGATLGSLAACSSVPNAVNPVAWYRGLTGASKDDNLGNGENQQNLDEGSKEPYPNLANVPEAPDTQLSGVDRDKLVNSLVADRNNAQYSADNLRAGEVASNVPPPAPPAPATATTGAVTASTGAAPNPAPSTPSTPTPAPSTASSGLLPPQAAPPAAPASTASAPPPARRASTTIGGGSQASLPPRGSEAPPAESSLQSPSIPNVPQGESATPVPPPPRLPAPTEVASAAPPAAPTRAPVLHPPTQQASAPANTAATAPSHQSAISYRIADVSFAPGSAYLSGALRGTIAEVVKLHNEQGGTIRIVGFGEATGKDAAVAGLTLALDRAQAVAVALTDSGVAAKDINVEAAPVPARGGADAPRAEIYLEQ